MVIGSYSSYKKMISRKVFTLPNYHQIRTNQRQLSTIGVEYSTVTVSR